MYTLRMRRTHGFAGTQLVPFQTPSPGPSFGIKLNEGASGSSQIPIPPEDSGKGKEISDDEIPKSELLMKMKQEASLMRQSRIDQMNTNNSLARDIDMPILKALAFVED